MTDPSGPPRADSFGAEARRQQALLAALRSSPSAATPLLAVREAGARAARGLAVYRANAAALAERALAGAFPMVQAMVGAEDFAQIARALWRSHPPRQGDVGEWGGALPEWIEAQADLSAWPWLADCARLEWACHRCERAADVELDAASLAWLGDADPVQIRLVLAPGTWVLDSRWPLAMIHEAHGQAHGQAHAGAGTDVIEPDREPADEEGAPLRDSRQADDARRFAAVRAALAEGRGQAVVVARQGWRAVVHEVDPATVAWTLDLLAGMSLGHALERAGGGFDFAAWLSRALRQSWLKGVQRCAD